MNALFPPNVPNLILYPEHLIGYKPNDARAFQWPIEPTFASRIQLDPDRTIEIDFVTNHNDPAKGFIRWINGKLHFQLKLNPQVFDSVVPRVPEHVRRAQLAREQTGVATIRIQNNTFTLTILDLEDPSLSNSAPYGLTPDANTVVERSLSEQNGSIIKDPPNLHPSLPATLFRQTGNLSGMLKKAAEHPNEFRFYPNN